MATEKSFDDADAAPPPGGRRHFALIVNPQAGGGSTRAARVLAHLTDGGCHVEQWQANSPDELAAHIRNSGKTGVDAIIVAGGDGTLRTALQAQKRNSAPIALLPCGTANVIARDTGLPANAATLARIYRHGPARTVHGGRVNDSLFLMSAGVGFDARVVSTVNPALKRYTGRLAYAAAAMTLWRHWGDEGPYLVSIDDAPAEEAASLIVLNTRLYGGGFMLDPEGGVDRPGLRVILFHGGRRRDVMRYALAGAMGRLQRLKDVTFRQAQAIRIFSPLDRDLCQIDGDPGPACPLTITALDAAGRLILPN